MSILAVVIINSDNHPVFIKTRRDLDESSMSEEENMNLLYNLNAALDIVQENQSHSRDPYLGLLTQCESYRIYGYLSATRVKILLMVATNVDVMFRDTEARNTLKQLHSLYIDVVSYNPFCCPGSEVKSEKLEDLVKGIFRVSTDYNR